MGIREKLQAARDRIESKKAELEPKQLQIKALEDEISTIWAEIDAALVESENEYQVLRNLAERVLLPWEEKGKSSASGSMGHLRCVRFRYYRHVCPPVSSAWIRSMFHSDDQEWKPTLDCDNPDPRGGFQRVVLSGTTVEEQICAANKVLREVGWILDEDEEESE